MKIIKNKLGLRYVISFTIIAGFLISVFVKVSELENVKASETTDMEQYRRQYSVFEANEGDSYYNDDKIVDIIKLLYTVLEKEKTRIMEGTEDNFIPFVPDTENKENEEMMITDSKGTEKIQTQEKTQTYQDIDCILKIPSINLEKPVYHKNIMEYLDHYYLVTAYNDMNFNAGGTYIIYGHNSYIENLSFQKLPQIQLNDEIIIEYENKNFEFIVTNIQTVKTDQISDYFIQEENKIVLVACTNQSTKTNPEYFIVVAKRQMI